MRTIFSAIAATLAFLSGVTASPTSTTSTTPLPSYTVCNAAISATPVPASANCATPTGKPSGPVPYNTGGTGTSPVVSTPAQCAALLLSGEKPGDEMSLVPIAGSTSQFYCFLWDYDASGYGNSNSVPVNNAQWWDSSCWTCASE